MFTTFYVARIQNLRYGRHRIFDVLNDFFDALVSSEASIITG